MTTATAVREVELALLAGVLTDGEAARTILATCRPEDFATPEARAIFAAADRVAVEGTPDLALVAGELRTSPDLGRSPREMLVEAVEFPFSPANLPVYLARLRAAAEERRGDELRAALAATLRSGSNPGAVAAAARALVAFEDGARNDATVAADALNVPPDPRPVLAPEADYGLPGRWWRFVEPYTEGARAAVIAQFYVIAGNVIGRRPFLPVGPGDGHHAAEFVLIVGESGIGAKGDGLKAARLPFARGFPDWDRACVKRASNSSAGLIYMIRDPVWTEDPTTGERRMTDPGVEDRRACFLLSEYGSLLRTFERQADTSSMTWRDLWDQTRLENNSRGNAGSATDYHVSLIGHGTPTELRKYLRGDEVFSGFANRHLAIWSERSKGIPTPARMCELDLAEFVRELVAAVEAAQRVEVMERDADADALWTHLYADLLNVPRGFHGALLERGRGHVARVSMIAALLDGARVVRVPHLLAALALWDYSAATWAYLFGDSCGDPKADRMAEKILAAGGEILHSELHEQLGRNWVGGDYAHAARVLTEAGRLRVEDRSSAGRPGRWYVLTRRGAVAPILPKARAILAKGGSS